MFTVHSICQFFQYYILVYRMFTFSHKIAFVLSPAFDSLSLIWVETRLLQKPKPLLSPTTQPLGISPSCQKYFAGRHPLVLPIYSPHWSLTLSNYSLVDHRTPFSHFVFCISLRQRDFWKPIVGRYPPPLPLPICLSTSELGSPSCKFDNLKIKWFQFKHIL